MKPSTWFFWWEIKALLDHISPGDAAKDPNLASAYAKLEEIRERQLAAKERLGL